MKRRLSEIGNRIKKDIRQYGLGLILALMLYFLFHALFDAFCPSVLLSGFPCPGCGMTRAVLYLLRGQFARAWALNPAAFLWVLWAALFVWERYGKGRTPKHLLWMLSGILLFMVVVYVFRMWRFFPDRPPYVYRQDNLFARTLPGYETVVRHLMGRFAR